MALTQVQQDFIDMISAEGYDITQAENVEELADIWDSIPPEEFEPLNAILGCKIGCYPAYFRCVRNCGGAYPCRVLCETYLTACLQNCQEGGD
jgi:hypothetical protein